MIDRAVAALADRESGREAEQQMHREIADRLYDAKRQAAVEYGFPHELVDKLWPPREVPA